jgi:heptosyltransferase II
MDILIIKVGALGDVLRSTFLAQALKEKFSEKNPRIHWLTDKGAKAFFVNNPYIHKVISSEERELLRNKKFDIVINLEEDEENSRFATSLKPKELIGFMYQNKKVTSSKTTKEWFDMSALGKKPKNDILKKANKKTHRQILSEIAEIKDYEKYEPFLRLTEKQRKISEVFMKKNKISRSEMVIGINTGSAGRWPKQLPIKNTISLIDNLYKKYNAKIILFGGPNEVKRNKQILRETKVPLIDAGCENSLLEFPALVSVCSLFITSDTLGLHVALALKRKTICLIGPTSSAEISMYGIGEKVISDSPKVCSYSSSCESMKKISQGKIMEAVNKLLQQKITLVITAFKEPGVLKALEAAMNQKTTKAYEVILAAPDKETLDIARKFSKKHKNLKLFKDPGKGKSYSLNLIFQSIKTDILILSDGDVQISPNSVEEISNLFLDPEIGCITGRPVPLENKKTKYGYWANFLFDAAHNIRKSAFKENSFIECSGYLFAFRKNKLEKIPLDVAEDTVIPYIFWEKGYKIGYAETARVYVKNAESWKDWIKQKIRTSKAHETLDKYVDIKTTPRTKSFIGESKGISQLFSYPKNIKEFFWTIQLVFARLYMWIKVFSDIKLKSKGYGDAWERIESTK